MHFFHPIQQCAQQLYHTALPLSPTSSLLRKSCLQNVIGNQLSHVTTFLGAPDTWGLFLRAIDVRPRELSCIATSVHGIIAACGDIVNVYDAITFVLRQSLYAPEPVMKIQDSPDGSILFFAHSSSATMWDVQTGGLIHTFITTSKIQDMAVSATGDYVACGSSGGSVALWNVHTKEEGKSFNAGQPVVAIYWLSRQVLVIATQDTLYARDITVNKTTDSLPIPGRVWGMVYSEDDDEFLVGVSRQHTGAVLGESFFVAIKYTQLHKPGPQGRKLLSMIRELPVNHRELASPVLVGGEIVCMTPAGRVQLFNTGLLRWTDGPPLLGAALSVAVSLNRNLVVQTKDSIQIFSVDVLTSSNVKKVVGLPHIYPLGENHIIRVLQPDRHLTLLEVETLAEVRSDDNASPFGSVSQVVSLLSKWKGEGEDMPLGGLSPKFTRIVTVSGSPRRWLRIVDAVGGRDTEVDTREKLEAGVEIYGITFSSETRFYLRIDGPGRHAQIPCDIVPWRRGGRHNITFGDPELLSEPRAIPPYTLDADCEWVLDAKSRKICWISPGDMRRGKSGHFWAGLSLVMVGGDDGVLKRLTFKDPGKIHM